MLDVGESARVVLLGRLPALRKVCISWFFHHCLVDRARGFVSRGSCGHANGGVSVYGFSFVDERPRFAACKAFFDN